MDRRTAVITGGSRGIGRAVAVRLAETMDIVISYAGNDSAAEETVTLCEQKGARAIAVRGDVSSLEDCERLVEEALGMFGSIDILVNNAGITRDNIIMRMTEEDFDRVIATNLKGTFNMMKLVSRPMMKHRSGAIINLSSVVGITGNAGQVNYAASKAGVIGMTKSLARELAGRGIRVNAVAPGFISTDMTAAMPEEAVKAMARMIPLGRPGTADDVAQAVEFLASAPYITGQVLPVDGGMCI